MYNTSCLKITAFRGCPRFLKNNKSFPIPLNPSPLLLNIQHFLSLEAFWSFRKLTLQRLWRDVFIKESNSGNKKVWLLVVSAFTGEKKKRSCKLIPGCWLPDTTFCPLLPALSFPAAVWATPPWRCFLMVYRYVIGNVTLVITEPSGVPSWQNAASRQPHSCGWKERSEYVCCGEVSLPEWCK